MGQSLLFALKAGVTPGLVHGCCIQREARLVGTWMKSGALNVADDYSLCYNRIGLMKESQEDVPREEALSKAIEAAYKRDPVMGEVADLIMVEVVDVLRRLTEDQTAVVGILDLMANRFDRVEKRLEKMEAKLTELDNRFSVIEGEVHEIYAMVQVPVTK